MCTEHATAAAPVNRVHFAQRTAATDREELRCFRTLAFVYIPVDIA